MKWINSLKNKLPKLLQEKIDNLYHFSPIQFSSVTQLCPTLCDPMDCSTPGFPVHHQLLELTQTHIHQVGDAIQPSHPLSSPSPSAFNLSQHQGLFKWVCSLHHVSYWSFSFSISLSFRGMYNFFGYVSSQQKFEATDVKALGVSQLSDSITAPCYCSVLFRK